MSERITLQERRTVQADGTIMTHRKMIDVATVREHAMDIYFELKKFEDILYDESGKEIISLDRLREIAEAEREGRLIVLPCKVGDVMRIDTEGFMGIPLSNMPMEVKQIVAELYGDWGDCKRAMEAEEEGSGRMKYAKRNDQGIAYLISPVQCARCDDFDHAPCNERGESIAEIIASLEDKTEHATTDGWIPCSERLPTEDDVYGRVEFEITVQSGEERYVTTGFYTEEQLWEDAKGNVIFVPIAYRSLPEPYKGE